METCLIDLLEADCVPNEVKESINKLTDENIGIKKSSKVGEVYPYYKRELVSKESFNTVREWAFRVLDEKKQRKALAGSS